MTQSPEPQSRYLVWAGDEFNRRFGDEHYLVVGASGSGKSTLINHLLHSVVSDTGVRALVYDPKQELVPFLYGIRGVQFSDDGLKSSVKILHPFDERCLAWNMAADIDSPISARQLATILVPEAEGGGSGSEGFFTNAVRDILTGILLIFIRCLPKERTWTFRDVLLALLYEPYRKFLLNFKRDRDGNPFPIAVRLEQNYFGAETDSRTRANIQATITAKLSVYEPVAAAWHRAAPSAKSDRWFSLREWIDEAPSAAHPGSLLILGNDEAARAALDPINQALFKRATELVLARRERTAQEKKTGANQIWFVLDEIREAGKLDGLGRLLTKGRSKNACVAMGFQDIDGMREVYGEEVANEICAQFNNIAVLRVNSPETAEWASNLFGRRLEYAKNTSTGLSTGQQSALTMTQGQSEEERPFLYTEAFLFGANAAAAKKVEGYRRGPDIVLEGLTREQAIQKFHFTEPSEAPRKSIEELIALAQQTTDNDTRNHHRHLLGTFAERPPSDQYLQPWNETDWTRLGLKKFKKTPIEFDAKPETVPEIVWRKKLPRNINGK
jgi:type IV secretory pathway TraG/TraD family ATPase VirD4